MNNENKNICVKVIGVLNPKGEWIGNIAIDVETWEVSSYLKNGYSLQENEIVEEKLNKELKNAGKQ